MKKRIGLFGGSFNPIHIGHLALANYLCEFDIVDEVWFVVSPLNPLKQRDELWDDELRLRLVRAATAEYAKFKVCDVEFHLPQPSYTIRTLDHLRTLNPEHSFHLIIGSDNWLQFDAWREHKRILQEYHIVIYPRPGYETDESTLPPHVSVVHAPLLDISSTFIRQALRTGKNVRYFLHPSTLSYIYK